MKINSIFLLPFIFIISPVCSTPEKYNSSLKSMFIVIKNAAAIIKIAIDIVTATQTYSPCSKDSTQGDAKKVKKYIPIAKNKII